MMTYHAHMPNHTCFERFEAMMLIVGVILQGMRVAINTETGNAVPTPRRNYFSRETLRLRDASCMNAEL